MKEEVKNPTDERLKDAFSALPHADAEQLCRVFKNASRELCEAIASAQAPERWSLLVRGVVAERNKAFRFAVIAMAAFFAWALLLAFEPSVDLLRDWVELPVFVFLVIMACAALRKLSKKDGLARHVAFLDYLNTEKGKQWREFLRDELGYEVEPLEEKQ